MHNDILLCSVTTITRMLCEYLFRFSQSMLVVVVTQRNRTSSCTRSIVDTRNVVLRNERNLYIAT